MFKCLIQNSSRVPSACCICRFGIHRFHQRFNLGNLFESVNSEPAHMGAGGGGGGWGGNCILNQDMCICVINCFQLFATLWTAARQAPLSMRFSRQEHWSGLLCPPPRDLPNLGTEPTSLASLALAGGFFTTSATWEAQSGHTHI